MKAGKCLYRFGMRMATVPTEGVDWWIAHHPAGPIGGVQLRTFERLVLRETGYVA